MKAESINAFYRATQDVFHLMLDLSVERGDIKVIEGLVSSRNANVILGVTGDLKGSILFSFTQDMTLEMVRIMSGMEMRTIDNFVSSALGEVANIIGGNAVTNLTGYNYMCDIVPPQIVLGVNKSVSMATDKAISVSLKTEIGEFDICVSLKEK